MVARFSSNPSLRRIASHLCSLPAILLATTLLQSAAIAAPDTGATPPKSGTAASGELDELVVTANHLWVIRRAIREVEDRFYLRYNQLNTNDEFDVICVVSAPTGTRLNSRSCRISYHLDALQEEAIAFVNGTTAPQAEMVRLERIADYRKHALKIINGDPELRKLIRQREKLGTLLKTRYKEVFQSRWIDW